MVPGLAQDPRPSSRITASKSTRSFGSVGSVLEGRDGEQPVRAAAPPARSAADCRRRPTAPRRASRPRRSARAAGPARASAPPPPPSRGTGRPTVRGRRCRRARAGDVGWRRMPAERGRPGGLSRSGSVAPAPPGSRPPPEHEARSRWDAPGRDASGARGPCSRASRPAGLRCVRRKIPVSPSRAGRLQPHRRSRLEGPVRLERPLEELDGDLRRVERPELAPARRRRRARPAAGVAGIRLELDALEARRPARRRGSAPSTRRGASSGSRSPSFIARRWNAPGT